VVPSDRTRGNEHKLKHRRLYLNITKHILTVKMIEHLNRPPGETAESCSLEILKT